MTSMNVPVELSSRYCYLAGESIRDIFDESVFQNSRNHLLTLGLIFVFLLFVSNHQYVKELVCVSSTEELTFQIYNFFRKKKKIYVFFSIFFNVLSSSRQPYNQNLSVFSTKTSKIFNFFSISMYFLVSNIQLFSNISKKKRLNFLFYFERQARGNILLS